MMTTWVVGILLLVQGQWLGAGWFQVKFVAVLAMTILHGLFSRWVNEFHSDQNRHTQKFFRIINEVPTVLLIVIVVLATVKPF
jgi:protoporphyrinogen IX oxidase